MYQIYCIPYTDFGKGYNSDLGVDHWTTVKIILIGLRRYFSIMEMIKRFVIKGYVNASFDTDPDDSKSQSGCILKVGAIARVAPCRALLT